MLLPLQIIRQVKVAPSVLPFFLLRYVFVSHSLHVTLTTTTKDGGGEGFHHEDELRIASESVNDCFFFIFVGCEARW